MPKKAVANRDGSEMHIEANARTIQPDPSLRIFEFADIDQFTSAKAPRP